jgi:hypothetical protein
MDHGIRGIEGLHPKQPIGAVLTIGKKGPKGPVDRDRFYIKLPTMDGNDERPEHPSFARFNKADLPHRTVIRGNVVHNELSEFFHHSLKAYKLGRGFAATPRGEPACVGNGKEAVRYMGTEQGFVSIPCPNELCEFRLCEPKLCKPFASLLFRPSWRDDSPLPSPLMKFTTASWDSVSSLAGLFEFVDSTAKELGLDQISYFGLPFTLVLSEKKNKNKGTRFPIVTASLDCDVMQFLARQKEQMQSIGATPRYVSLLDAEANAPDAIEADLKYLNPETYTPKQIKGDIE